MRSNQNSNDELGTDDQDDEDVGVDDKDVGAPERSGKNTKDSLKNQIAECLHTVTLSSHCTHCMFYTEENILHLRVLHSGHFSGDISMTALGP